MQNEILIDEGSLNLLIDNTHVGYLFFSNVDEDLNSVKIIDFLIYAKYRRKGYGTEMLSALKEHLLSTNTKRIYGDLCEFDNKSITIPFYTKNGFTIINNDTIEFLFDD